MKRLPKGFYFGSIVGGEVGGIALLVVGISLFFVAGMFPGYCPNPNNANIGVMAIGVLLIFLGCAAILFATSIWTLLLYRAWEAIQDGSASTTPEKAIGFLFIPFFNFYWLFRAWYGLAQDYNRYFERHGVSARKLEESLFLAFCILSICSMVPLINYLAALPLLVIFIITANNTIDAVNALPIDLIKGKANK